MRTKGLLVVAAAEVFAREGYAGASLGVICARAGVSSGALHFHFENKVALARAVVGAASETFGEIVGEEWANGSGGVLQTVVDRSHLLVGALGGDVVVRAGFGLSSGMVGEGLGVACLRGEWRRWVEERFVAAHDGGELAQGVSVWGAVSVVVGATVGFEVLGGGDSEWLTRRRVTSFWEVVLPGLAGVGAEVAPGGPALEVTGESG